MCLTLHCLLLKYVDHQVHLETGNEGISGKTLQ